MAGSCVRVDPPLVQFSDVSVGQVFKIKITVENVGKTWKKIMMGKPGLKLFKFTASSSAVMVAPGLSVSGLLEFIPEKEEEVRDRLLVHVDKTEIIEVPLLGCPKTCSFLMDSVVDFGCIAANSQVITKYHSITNEGSAPGLFQVHYNGDPSVSLSPCTGVIRPRTTQWLRVELRTDKPRRIDECAEVKLLNRPAVLSIRAEVVDQCLEVFDMQGAPLSCLCFGPVYFGTSSVEKAVLRNNGPQACDWVCLLQHNAAGTEAGTDLQKNTDVTLLDRMEKCSSFNQDISEVLVCVPQEGRLGPYEKTTVTILFSPRNKRENWKSLAGTQDYCLFVLFESIESKHGFTHPNGKSSVELAVTGTGLPVVLVPRPSHHFDFQTCAQGQGVDLLCVLQNFCLQLPITFCFHKLAHFNAKPSAGTIPPGGCQDIVLSFNARQQGNFHVRQKLNVLGLVVQEDGQHAEDVTALELCSFHTITLHLSAVCLNETIQPAPKLNPGITPLLTNPTGPQPDVPFRELACCRAMAQAAVLFFDKTRLHEHRRRQNIEEEEFVAFPNDRATSTRPATANKKYRTVFTGVQRYCYLDTTYSFTEEEEKQRKQHKQIYINFLKQLRQTRLQRIKEKKHEKTADVDIGMIPFHGLVPPAPRISELGLSANSETTENYRHPFRELGQSRRGVRSLTPQVPEAINAVPSNKQEVADCAKTLTAQELYQLDIGPLFVDFGEVCVQSVCVQKLELTNHLSVFVWVQLEVDCPELQGSSPLSHVLPPHSLSSLRLIFQSNKLGPFYRPMSYSVNQQHNGQIVVQAQVVPLALELSTTLLVLRQIPNLLAQSGYRSSVTIKNQCNQVAEFTWRPVVTQSGNPFSIRPATGRVEPYSELVCEVVWHPSFSSPQQGDFDLLVHEGNTQRLHCVAKVGATSVQLPEKQVMFKLVPLNMCSTRTALLYNAGQNHAYYKVRDFCPLPGLVVSPFEGVVPSGGNALLSINFNPDSIISFDTRIEIALKDMKSLELRVIGSVEPPNIDISVSLFQFNGVYAGSRGTIPFSVTNYSAAAARVAFDFSEYTDFSLQLPQPAAEEKPGMHTVEIQSKATVDCCLIFSPTQDACYDFEMPVKVNGVRWPTASLSPLLTPSSSSTTLALPSAGSRKHLVKRLSVTMATPQSQRIQAAVLCAPLQMSPSRLQFYVEHFKLQSDDYSINKTVMLKAVCEKSVYWCSGVKEQVNWWFDCCAMVASTEDNSDLELCTVSPSSGSLGPGQSVCVEVSIKPETIRKASGQVTTISLPLYLRGEGIKGEKGDGPYRELSITITLRSPCITFHPPQILLTPVPLESEVTATLTLLALGYSSGTTVSAEVDEVELEDGTKIQPVSVVFPDGNIISAPQQDERYPVSIPNKEAKTTALMCSVSFCSARPVSLCTTINFADHLHNKFKVKVYASADSCLLTVWPFMALHRSEQKIVLQPGMTTVEAIPQGQRSSTAVSILTSSSTSLFNFSSSVTSDSVSDSYEGGECLSDQARRDSICSNGHTPTNIGLPEFPPVISQEGLYHQKVLLAVERWFSFFGWPGGPHPISVPHTLRRLVSERLVKFSSGQCQRVTLNRDCRSVVDMLHHLTGKHIPGIPRFHTFSNDVAQRTHQLLQQHEAMLAFLRVQGAFLCHIRPEFLLDIQEFKHWCSLQSNEKVHGLDYSSVDYESLSKGSWTDVLLQIYRVLVLSRVSRRGLDKSLEQGNMNGILPFSSQSLTSNVYSGMELQLLSWVNMHYQSSREAVWGTDGAPSARWIVNFDLDFKDGLVLAALLAAYCPFLIQSHFQRMYTEPSSLEQVLHNNIIVFEALNTLHLNLDVQPTDLSNPNPVQILMLCVHLYERLPQYLPLHTIELSGDLHTMFSKQVRLKNPSPKPVKYQACLFGENAHHFSLPNGSTVTIPSRSSTELNVLYYCSFMQSMEAVLLLISGSPFGLQGRTLTFRLKTRISHITPTNTVRCKSPCYQMKIIQLPITNPFKKEAKFRVVLVESEFNPLEPKKKRVRLVHNSSETNPEAMTLNKTCGEDLAENCSINGEANDFCCAVRSICLTPGQEENLEIHYLPFSLGTKYCSVLLVCPQVGDIVYMIEATAELPLPSPLTARPSDNIVIVPNSPVLSIHCKIWQVCEEMVYVPLNNVAWENALAIWGQHSMSADEHRRRMLTNSLHSSAVRANTAASKLLIQQTRVLRGDQPSKGVQYSVEVSLPQYFALPSVVNIHVKEDNVSWQNTADHCYVEIPVRFQADSVGRFKCQMVLNSWSDTRVYEMEALVTSEEESVHLNFSSPIYQSVTQDIPLYNDTRQDWKMQAVVCGEGFSGPEVVIVPAGTKTYYPLTFNPSAQCIVMGKLSLQNECYGTKSLFILRGVGEHPLSVDHVVLHCPVGQTTRTQLDVPNYSQKKLTLKVETDLSIVSGTPFLEIKPGRTAPYTLSVTPWKRGKETGCVSFHETDGIQEADKDKGDILRHYKVFFSLEIICEPAAPVGVINVQCTSVSLVDIEIPVNNPRNEQLMLDVYLEGDNLTGANCVLIPALETLTYKATYSPGSVGKTTGSVLFYSELVGEFWYELALYALPPPVLTLPLICCPLGKLTTQAIPLVNPTEETVKLLVTNSNPRHYTVEMDSGNTLVVEPHSSTQVAVHFRPSSIGEEKHTAKITFKGPEFQEWCVFLTGRGLNPEGEEPVSISSLIGTSTSITIPFTNPADFPVMLGVTLTDEDPHGGTSCHQVTSDKEVFSIPLHHTKGILINKGASFDVPVVFAPNSMGLKHIWLCITMKPVSSNNTFSTDSVRPEQELSTICWIYHVCGIPMEVSVENSALGVIQCEAGHRLEKTMDILLAGYVPRNHDKMGHEVFQVSAEDFVCSVHSDSKAEVEDWLSAFVKAGRRDPETGLIILTLNVAFTPPEQCRCSVFLVVQCASGMIWQFPFNLIATKPYMDDVIVIDATEVGKTSSVGFHLTSTTRRSEPFTAAFLPGSSSEFTVTPASGILPPVSSAGKLITVSFTSTTHSRHRARLTIQAADMQCIYEVKGETLHEFSPLCSTSTDCSSNVLRPARGKTL